MLDWTADTNIWLRSSDPAHEMFPAATGAVERILETDEIYLLPQIVTEFWRVATATGSQRGGFGWDVVKADLKIQQLESDFPIKHDNADVYAQWRALVRLVGVSGAQVYDARIVAAMLAHNITRLLTFNTEDFRRYAAWGITVVHPSEV
jgi:predicted nucleic acid-binding protein